MTGATGGEELRKIARGVRALAEAWTPPGSGGRIAGIKLADDLEALASSPSGGIEEGARGEGTEWFWRIVDHGGLGNVPSDEIAALNLLCHKAARYDEMVSGAPAPPSGAREPSPSVSVLPDVAPSREAIIAALAPFARAARGIPDDLPDDLWTSCNSYDWEMSQAEYDDFLARGVPLLDRRTNLSLWIDGHPLGDFRRAAELHAALVTALGIHAGTAETAPLGPQAVSPAPSGVMPEGVIAEIAAERRRQVEVEGWSTEHDDREHAEGDLAVAAACYALASTQYGPQLATDYDRKREGYIRESWPWNEGWWKPRGQRRDLVKAGALIIAEIERLDRTAPTRDGGAS